MDDLGIGAILFFVMVASLGVMFLISGPLSYESCYYSTRDIGFEHRWGIFEDCQIETKPGVWAPLENYRVNEPIGKN